MAYSIEKSLKDLGDKVPADTKKDVEEKLAALRDALKTTTSSGSSRRRRHCGHPRPRLARSCTSRSRPSSRRTVGPAGSARSGATRGRARRRRRQARWRHDRRRVQRAELARRCSIGKDGAADAAPSFGFGPRQLRGERLTYAPRASSKDGGWGVGNEQQSRTTCLSREGSPRCGPECPRGRRKSGHDPRRVWAYCPPVPDGTRMGSDRAGHPYGPQARRGRSAARGRAEDSRS